MPGTFLHTDAGQDQASLNGDSGLFLGGNSLGFGGLGGRPSNATANPFGGNRPLGAGSGSVGMFGNSSAGGGGGGGTGLTGGFLKPSALGKRGKKKCLTVLPCRAWVLVYTLYVLLCKFVNFLSYIHFNITFILTYGDMGTLLVLTNNVPSIYVIYDLDLNFMALFGYMY